MTALQHQKIRVAACLLVASVLPIGSSEGTPSGAATSIGDLVWLDENRTGIQPDDPIGIPGVRVELQDPSGNFLDEVLTDANGRYGFHGLTPGLFYRIRVEVPPGFVETLSNEGDDDTRDSDTFRSTETIPLIPLVDALDATRWDIGLYRGEIGDRVWNDLDFDGRQDTGEPGLAGVVVELLDEERNVVDSAVTDSEGAYVLTGNGFEFYRVRVQTPPGYGVSPHDVGDDLQDSDIDTVTAETAVFRLSDPLEHLRWDAGLHTLPSVLGDRVWLDVSRTGIQPATPLGVAGIRVELLAGNATSVLAETETDETGTYRFEGLQPGATYRVRVVPPATYLFSRADQGTDDERDSDVDPITGLTPPIVLGDPRDPTRWDIGLAPAEIGDLVWQDNDRNGRQSPFEPGFGGVTVELLDASAAVVDTTVTQSNGQYRFSGIAFAEYRVRVLLPPGYTFAIPNSGSDGGDSDFDVRTGETELFLLSDPLDGRRWDAGLHLATTTIGDRVWLDERQTGIQRPSPTGVPGIALELLDEDGAVVATTVSDADGHYAFEGLVPRRDYRIRAVLPREYRATLADQGDDLRDSDIDPEEWVTPAIFLGDVQDPVRWDIGLIAGSTRIGGGAWRDLDGDGFVDPDEPALADVTFELLDRTGAVIAETHTDLFGDYLFEGLTVGDTYRLRVETPAGYALSPQNRPDDARNSYFDPTTGETELFVLFDQDEALGWYAGFIPQPAFLGDFVWIDSAGTGIQPVEPVGFPDMRVELLDASGTVIRETETDREGRYLFAGLTNGGTYRIRVRPPPGWMVSPRDQGYGDPWDDNRDSDVDATGTTPPFVLEHPEDATRWDIGLLVGSTSIGDRVWHDAGQTGVQPGIPTGIPDVRVELLDAAGAVIAETRTGSFGHYLFEGLTVGESYRVRVEPPPGYILTLPDRGADDARDSDFDPVTRKTLPIVLGLPGDPTRWDAGMFVPTTSIGDRVWLDADRTGIQPVEPVGIPDVRLELLDDLGVPVAETLSDETGHYTFDALAPGRFYQVRVDPPTQYVVTLPDRGSDDRDSDVQPDTLATVPFRLGAPLDPERWDVGLTAATLGDRVWFDANRNGRQESDEPGIAGVTVELLNVDGAVLATGVTDAEGRYGFPGVAHRQYMLRIQVPDGYALTAAGLGPDAADSDFDRSTGKTPAITLARAEDAERWDAGLVASSPLAGNRLWKDANANGVQDFREPGLPGHRVQLLTSSGEQVDEQTTDAIGSYRFGGLDPGRTYVIRFIPPAGTRFTAQDAGGDDQRDSDADARGRIALVQAEAPGSFGEFDAGVVPECPFPVEPVFFVNVSSIDGGPVTLDWVDPNPSSVVSGYTVRRSPDAGVPILRWDVFVQQERRTTWADPEPILPGEIRYYLIGAFHEACNAEGPW